jgi:hypothetical protein
VAERLQIHLDAIDNTRKAFTAFQTRLDKIKSSVFNLRSALLGIGAGAVIKGFVDAGIQIENLGVQLTALFGSAKAGKDALKVVTDFAKTTPFELSNIQQGVVALATVREVAEEAGVSFEELLKITGNTATLLGGDFALASLQIQRSFSAGIASAELFRERGITAMAGFQSGTRTSIDESIKGLRKAFGTGGIFGNLIGELSKTLFGTVSNLKDAFFTFQVAVSTGFFSELKKQLGELKSFIESNDKAIEKFGVSVGQGLSRAIVSLANAGRFVAQNFNIFKNILIGIISIKILTFLSQFVFLINDLRKAMLTLNIAMLANPLFLGASAVALIVTGIYAISSSMKDASQNANSLAEGFKAINDEIPMVGQDLFPNIPTAPFEREVVFVQDDSLDLFTEIQSKVENTKSGMDRILESLQKANEKDLKAFKESWSNIYETIGVGINNSIKSMSVGIAESIVLGKNLSDTFRQLAQQILVNIVAKTIERIILMGIEKVLSIFLTDQEAKKENLIRKQNSALKQQIALQAILTALGGGGGFFGFAEGGRVNGTRANGGQTSNGNAYMVGERGRELFIPSTDGQIVPNERLGGMGSTNISFTVQATDVKGVKELLIDNRATITNIINSALNQKGKPALI